ncbi:feruloyl-CoA synthase [Bacillus pakistanensis]|uniref:Feruloyl-CoA synthase n=1 Tax=Rossellomorea pakistanensis TaxID=992288 RepID=A0ABS2N895_9BACI|nr:long-chain-fatty-acid--CoA ligase [Bacillus pakistanensis]MBM7583984.1 feruloyl-CoA synthase [Bacillus pakistanensis]
MNLSELLARNARKYPNQEAVVVNQERISYRELHQETNRFAAALQSLGVGCGDKVVLFMPNTKEFMISYFAVVRLGAIIVPINAKLTLPEVEYIVEHCDASALLVHEWLWEGVSGVECEGLILVKTGKATEGWRSFEEVKESESEKEIICSLQEDDDAAILYTSGTTGKPKGVLFTNRSILAVAIMMSIEMEYKPESRILHMMPLSHSAPLHLFMIGGMYVGATHVLSPTFTPEALLNLVEKEKITHFFGAPVAYLFTAKMPNIQSYNLSSMKYWVYGGASLSKPDVKMIKEKFQTNSLCCVYGLTEAGPSGTLLRPEEHETKSGSIGKRGALGTEILIINKDGEKVAPNEVGELILRGEGNMKKYYKDFEKTLEVFENGWIRTGDLAKYDENGYIWIVDRKKDLIISGGVNIYPKEIEDLLVQLPYISDVAVVGVPHPEWGETVKAFIVATEVVDNLAEKCKRFLSGGIADYKIPKKYEQVSELPRNATGKILKHVLRERTDGVLQ